MDEIITWWKLMIGKIKSCEWNSQHGWDGNIWLKIMNEITLIFMKPYIWMNWAKHNMIWSHGMEWNTNVIWMKSMIYMNMITWVKSSYGWTCWLHEWNQPHGWNQNHMDEIRPYGWNWQYRWHEWCERNMTMWMTSMKWTTQIKFNFMMDHFTLGNALGVGRSQIYNPWFHLGVGV